MKLVDRTVIVAVALDIVTSVVTLLIAMAWQSAQHC